MKSLWITKQEWKALNVKEAFENGIEYIKITNGVHTVFNIEGVLKVVREDELHEDRKAPKYITKKIAGITL